MGLASNASSALDVSRLVILSVVIIVVVVVLTLALAWARSKRDEEGGVLDVDWDEERKKLEALAAEKLAKRQAYERGGTNPPAEHEDDVEVILHECVDEDAGEEDFSDGAGI